MKNFSFCVLFLFTMSFCFSQASGRPETTNHYFKLVRPVFKGDLAYNTTTFVEKYWRVAGNTGFNESVNRIAEELERAGYVLQENASKLDRLSYRIEKSPLKNHTWEPVDAEVRIVGQDHALLRQDTNRNMVYLNSFSTPKEGVIGEVVRINSPDALKKVDVEGKIIYIRGDAGEIFEEGILKQGALGIVSYNNPDYLRPEINTTSIQFRSLPSQTNSKSWGIALSYEANEELKAALEKGKVELKVNIHTKIYASEELTIIADVKGSVQPDERLVFSAHIQEPGANDNASGVGTQLEMAVITANLLKNDQIDLARTLTFLWGDEIRSTHRYIQENKERAKHIKWGISLDMVGENTAITGGSFLIEKMPDPSAIWTRGNDKHTEWGGEVLKLEDMKPHYLNDFILLNFKKQGDFAHWEINTNPFEGGSDHMPFLDADIPGLLLWHFTDQFYHTDNDRIDKVSKETLKNVGIGALASAYTLLNADTQTASEVLKDLSKAAEVRMAQELELSRESLAKGKKLEDELKILNAWQDWYLKAMESVSDMETNKTKQLSAQIKKAQANLRKTTKMQIYVLKKV